MAAIRGVRRPVDEMFQNRHGFVGRSAVESAVRAAGGFPTQGGGLRASVAICHAGLRGVAV